MPSIIPIHPLQGIKIDFLVVRGDQQVIAAGSHPRLIQLISSSSRNETGIAASNDLRDGDAIISEICDGDSSSFFHQAAVSSSRDIGKGISDFVTAFRTHQHSSAGIGDAIHGVHQSIGGISLDGRRGTGQKVSKTGLLSHGHFPGIRSVRDGVVFRKLPTGLGFKGVLQRHIGLDASVDVKGAIILNSSSRKITVGVNLFVFTVKLIMLQSGQALLGKGGLHLIDGPVAAAFVGGIVQLLHLGDEVSFAVEVSAGGDAFAGTEHLVMFPGGLDTGGLEGIHDRGGIPFFAFVLDGIQGISLGLQIEHHIKAFHGADVLVHAMIDEVLVQAFVAFVAGSFEGSLHVIHSRPGLAVVQLAFRVDSVQLIQLALEIEVRIKPGRISHCYPPEDNERFCALGTRRIRPVRMRPRRDEPLTTLVSVTACGLVTSMEVPSHVGPGHVARPHARGRPSSGVRHRYG